MKGMAWLGLLLALPVSAEILRWRDEQGQWHFSDRAPAEVDAKPVLVSHPISVVSGAPEVLSRWQRTLADPDADRHQKQATAAKHRQALAEQRARDKQRQDCARLVQRRERLEARMRLGYRGKTGARLALQLDELERTWWQQCR